MKRISYECTWDICNWLIIQKALPTSASFVNYMQCIQVTVQFTSKFTARSGQHAFLARSFAGHEKLHAFDTRVSRLLVHAIMLASYATCDLYVLTHIPMQDRLAVHANLLTSRAMQ